jgi:hypothetical protein
MNEMSQAETLFDRLKKLLDEHLDSGSEIKLYIGKETIDTDDDIVALVKEMIMGYENDY